MKTDSPIKLSQKLDRTGPPEVLARGVVETRSKVLGDVRKAVAGRRANAVESKLCRMRSLVCLICLAVAAPAAASIGLVACGETRPALPALSATDAATATTPPTADTVQRAIDAGVANALDAGQYDGPRLGALFLQTPIMSDMEWLPSEESRRPLRRETKEHGDVVRLGYMRQGGRAPVLSEAHRKPNCPEGWYELLAGGFVCGKYATLDLNHPRVKLAPHAPDLVGSLPYQYGYNITNGTPLYRTIPSREDRIRFEPWLTKRATPKPRRVEDDSYTTATTDPDLDAGAGVLNASTTTDPLGAGFEPVDAGVPWYLRDYDGGKPTVTLDELKGEGPMSRRMVKGFYLALDKEMKEGPTRWWKTTGGLLAPFDKIYVNKTGASEFHGIWLQEPAAVGAGTPDGGAPTAPAAAPATAHSFGGDSRALVGFVLWTHAHKYSFDEKKKATQGEPVARFTIVRLTGETVTTGGYAYDETTEGWWLRGNEGTKTKPGPAPTDLAPNEKWVDVNLTNQTLVAFEGDKPVYATLVSTGRRNLQIKEKDHPTVKGSFRIREKHIAATMDGDVASDGPYSIEDVPWIMYFSGSYALHGAFWHNNFGHTQSHGCVNLAPLDAKAIFGWTEPSLPEGWHGVMATESKPGSRVVVHD